MENEIYLSIVIPMYNEAKRLSSSLERIQSFSQEFGFRHEWIFVIEPSQDRTFEIAADFASQHANVFVIANKVHKGKGFAVQTGMLHAKGEWVLFMDADLSTPLYEIHNFLEHIKQNPDTDILIGSRKQEASRILKQQSPLRILMGSMLNSLLKSLDLTDFEDTQCGFKLFKRHTIRPLFTQLLCSGFSFDIEVLARAKKYRYKIVSKAIAWKDDKDSTVRLFSDSVKVLRDIVRIHYHLR